jgi:hypothetical protein
MRCTFLIVFFASCSPPSAPTTASKPKPPPPSVAVATKGQAIANADSDVRRRPLRPDDFTESDSNRDPFRAPADSEAPPPIDVNLLMGAYACSELQMTGVVTGGLNPHAMFRDPRGLGYTVRVGDRICKTAEKVLRIVSDGVVVETPEGSGKASHLAQRRIAIPHQPLALADPLSLR